MTARFIVIEGIDGAGTTTQTTRLVDGLLSRGVKACGTREPSKGPIGKLIRFALTGDLMSESRWGLPEGLPLPHVMTWSAMAALFAADRLDHVQSTINPALQAGYTVICDRYLLSSLAYQSASSPHGIHSLTWLRAMNMEARRPDLTIVLDVDPKVAKARRQSRGSKPELFDSDELQEQLAKLYLNAADLLPPLERMVHVPDGTIDEVAARILQIVPDP